MKVATLCQILKFIGNRPRHAKRLWTDHVVRGAPIWTPFLGGVDIIVMGGAVVQTFRYGP